MGLAGRQHSGDSSVLILQALSDGTLDEMFAGDGTVNANDCERVPPTSPVCLDASLASTKLTISPETPIHRFNWKWRGSAATATYADLGTPNVDTQYTLCIWDTTAGTPKLNSWLSIPFDFWTDRPDKGWRSREMFPTDNGGLSLELQATPSGKAPRAKLRYSVVPAEYYRTLLPEPVSPLRLFEQDTEVIVQLVSSDGLCLQSSFDAAETKKNLAEQFSARD